MAITNEWKNHLPAIAMVTLQFMLAICTLLNRAALVEGMDPKVLIFYRQGIASLVICPFVYFKRRGSNNHPILEIKIFLLIFITTFIGVVASQFFHYEGLYLTSSSIANATSNLTPALTFLMAAIAGVEQVKMKEVSTLAKIMGTIICMGGAICMTLLRGPKLHNSHHNSPIFKSIFGDQTSHQTWLLGCLCLIANSFCWSLCLNLQVPILQHYSDPLSLSAWICFISTIQSGICLLLLEHDLKAWEFHSALELISYFLTGLVTAVQFFIISWCVSLKGPFYSIMFAPLNTVITTVLAFLILHEELYIGSLVGAIAVIIGLYFVLWGKEEETRHSLKIVEQTNCNIIDSKQPLLVDDPLALTRTYEIQDL